jgi:hypothetical protein
LKAWGLWVTKNKITTSNQALPEHNDDASSVGVSSKSLIYHRCVLSCLGCPSIIEAPATTEAASSQPLLNFIFKAFDIGFLSKEHMKP